jgi:hypothetical protein
VSAGRGRDQHQHQQERMQAGGPPPPTRTTPKVASRPGMTAAATSKLGLRGQAPPVSPNDIAVLIRHLNHLRSASPPRKPSRSPSPHAAVHEVPFRLIRSPEAGGTAAEQRRGAGEGGWGETTGAPQHRRGSHGKTPSDRRKTPGRAARRVGTAEGEVRMGLPVRVSCRIRGPEPSPTLPEQRKPSLPCLALILAGAASPLRQGPEEDPLSWIRIPPPVLSAAAAGGRDALLWPADRGAQHGKGKGTSALARPRFLSFEFLGWGASWGGRLMRDPPPCWAPRSGCVTAASSVPGSRASCCHPRAPSHFSLISLEVPRQSSHCSVTSGLKVIHGQAGLGVLKTGSFLMLKVEVSVSHRVRSHG